MNLERHGVESLHGRSDSFHRSFSSLSRIFPPLMPFE